MATEHSSSSKTTTGTATALRTGACVGGIIAPWPLARIQVQPDAVTVDFLGHYSFIPSDVQTIETVGTIPLLTTGLRIHHGRADYPEMFVIYCSPRARTALLQALRDANFTTGHPAIPTAPRGFPVRTKALVAALLAWNLMYVMGKLPGGIDGAPVAHREMEQAFYALLAPALVLLVASLAPRSRRIQRFLLRAGRQLGEIRGALRVLQALAAIALAVEATQLLAQ